MFKWKGHTDRSVAFIKIKWETSRYISIFAIILWISLHKLSHFCIHKFRPSSLLSCECLSQFSALLCSSVLMCLRETWVYQRILNSPFPQMCSLHWDMFEKFENCATPHKQNWLVGGVRPQEWNPERTFSAKEILNTVGLRKPEFFRPFIVCDFGQVI